MSENRGYKRPHKGRIRALVKLGGKRQHVGVFDTDAEADAAIAAALEAGVVERYEPPPGLTFAQYAARLGVKIGTVRGWVHSGMAGVNRDARTGWGASVDPEAADAWVREHRGESVAFNRRTVVYFMRDVATGEIKIGFSSDVRERVAEIRKHGRDPVVLATMQGDKTTESGMHARFAAYRIGETEWFEPAPKLLAFIRALAATEAA